MDKIHGGYPLLDRSCKHCGTAFVSKYQTNVCGKCAWQTQKADPEYRAKRAERQRYEYAARKYGISKEKAIEYREQDNCDICGRHRSEERYGTLHIDHDHQTGEVRGVLCNGCNRGIGFFQENVAVMAAAIEYLNRR